MTRIPSLAAARHPFDLSWRQAESLSELTDRSTSAIGGKSCDQCGTIVAVALVDARDQLLADVAGKVEVDVWQRCQLLVEEPPDHQLVFDWIDVGEAGQVADDRGDTRSSAPTGWKQGASAVRTTNFGRHLTRELEHVVVQQEEPGQIELLDDPQLFDQPRFGRLSNMPRLTLISVTQPDLAELCQVAHGGLVLGAWIAVSKIASQVESKAFR